jgi:hypothetical protein
MKRIHDLSYLKFFRPAPYLAIPLKTRYNQISSVSQVLCSIMDLFVGDPLGHVSIFKCLPKKKGT